MRILRILRSVAPRESRRLDLALMRGLMLIVLFLVLYFVSWLPGRLGPAMHGAMFGVSLLSLGFLAAWLGGDSVGDVRSGMLDLLFLAGLTPQKWLSVRLAQIWSGFASVWVIRLPLFFFIFTMGNVSIERVIVSEIFLLSGFLILSSLGLLASFRAKSRQQIYWTVLLSILFWEVALVTPNLLVNQLVRYFSWQVPLELLEVTEMIAELGFASHCRSAIFNPIQFADILPTILLYAALSALVLARFGWLLRAVSRGAIISSSVSQSRQERSNKESFRASRPCWDDALAWQAIYVHGNGKRLVKIKCLIVVALNVVLWFFFSSGLQSMAFFLVALIGFAMLFSATGKPGDCLTREIRDKTIPLLLLTPLDWDDYYAGWRRGAWHLAWPDILLAVGITLASFRLDPSGPVVTIAVAGAILCCGPFFMLSPLVPYSIKGIATGVLFILGVMLLTGVCVGIAVTVHPITLPATLIPAAFLFNLVLRRTLLPYWMRRKISTIVQGA